MYQRFLNLSVELCGLSHFQLESTGFADLYFKTVVGEVGAGRMTRLLGVYASLPGSAEEQRDAAMRAKLLCHEEFGPVARNIIKLWYAAMWFQMPEEWNHQYRAGRKNESFVPDAYAYPEAWLWPVVGSHVPGAKAPGYASWIQPPVFPD